MDININNLQKVQSIFWIEVEKIKPNTMQPRREFDEEALRDLSDSIRQYGVLQPLVVTRKETEIPTGTIVEYELIAGERRLRASKLAGLNQVPVLIHKEADDKLKLELAIIENLQREDLNSLERAFAFKRLVDEFKLKHQEVGNRVGKSRVFVSNTLRILNLPERIQEGLSQGYIMEGHTRPLLMVAGQGESEQIRFYNEILEKKMTVREAELASREIAADRVKLYKSSDPNTKIIEEKLSEALGTRVQIEKAGDKGRIHIDFFSDEELSAFLEKVMNEKIEMQDQMTEPNIPENIIEEDLMTAPAESATLSDAEDLTSNFSI